MKHYIIESPDNSEKSVVFDTTGYEGWSIIGETDQPPKEDEEWDVQNKKWVLNLEAKAKRDKEKQSRDIPALITRIETLEQTVADLKATIDSLTGSK